MDLAKADIKLDTKLVGTVAGKFYIPSYQRGSASSASRKPQ